MPTAEPTAEDPDHAGPSTMAGRWIRATMLRQPQLREHYRARLHAGPGGMSRDDLEVIRAASKLAVRRVFSPEDDVRKITRFVLDLRERFGPQAPGALEIEALIRADLGETDVATDDIPQLTVLAAATLTAALIAFQHALTDADVDGLVTAAESSARSHGWRPLPAH